MPSSLRMTKRSIRFSAPHVARPIVLPRVDHRVVGNLARARYASRCTFRGRSPPAPGCPSAARAGAEARWESLQAVMKFAEATLLDLGLRIAIACNPTRTSVFTVRSDRPVSPLAARGRFHLRRHGHFPDLIEEDGPALPAGTYPFGCHAPVKAPFSWPNISVPTAQVESRRSSPQ